MYNLIPVQQMKHHHVLEYKVLYHHVDLGSLYLHSDHLLGIIDMHEFYRRQQDYLPLVLIEKEIRRD